MNRSAPRGRVLPRGGVRTRRRTAAGAAREPSQGVASAFLALLVLLAAGCGEDKPLQNYYNTPPAIRSLTAEPDTLFHLDTARVACDATDPNRNDILRYRWSAPSGRFISRDPALSEVSWIAQETPGSTTISVTVDDGTDSTSASIALLVLGPSGTLVGTVKDAADQRGLSGAQLEIGDRRATSGDGGAYRIERIPAGTDTLRVGLSGYEPFERVLLIREGLVDTADVELTRVPIKSRLRGRVTNSLSRPVAGAVCRAAGLEVLADANGDYDFPEIPRAQQILTVRREGYVTRRDTLEIIEPEVVHDVSLDAAVPDQPQGTITAAKLGGLDIRITWTPAGDRPTIVAYDLYVIENDQAPQTVPGRQFGPEGGQLDYAGVEHHRYRFAVTATNFEGESGFLSDDTWQLVLTSPSPLARFPAGAFVMGDYPSGFGSEVHPGNPVSVGAFALETLEVTNRQFLAFLLEAFDRQQLDVTSEGVRADGRLLLSFDGSQIDADSSAGGFSVLAGRENHPVTGVSWHGADAYARSIGRRLPSEAEWEAAARGTSTANGLYPGTAIGVGSPYPWSNAPPDAQRANFGNLFGTTRPVGSFPAGAADRGGVLIYDLAGNVAEWCADWRAPYANPHRPPGSGTHRTVRGGHYGSGSQAAAPELLVGTRTGQTPETTSPRIGFRCAE